MTAMGPRLSKFAIMLALANVTVLAGCSGGGGSQVPVATTTTTGSTSTTPLSSASLASAPYKLGAVADSVAKQSLYRRPMSFTVLPTSVDFTATTPSVGDQGQEGSCVAWAIGYGLKGTLARHDIWSSVSPKTTSPSNNFSAAYVYNQINGGQDGGSSPIDAMNLLKSQGIATLADMPYIAGQYLTQPSAQARADAVNYKIASWTAINPTDSASGNTWSTGIRTALAQGSPVGLSIPVYSGFYYLNASQPLWSGDSGSYQGGHEVLVIGYNDATRQFKLQNSWGTGWGAGGYFYASYAIINQDAEEAVYAVDPAKPTPVPSASPKPTPVPTASPKQVPTPTPKPSPKPTTTPKPSPISTVNPHR